MSSAAWTLVRVVITGAVLAWIARGLDGRAAIEALRQFTWTSAVLALLLLAADRTLMFWRWRLLLVPATGLSDRRLARIFFVGSFLGSLLPAGVGGDAARAIAVGRHTGQSGPAVASVIADRWLGLLAVALSGCVGLIGSLSLVPDVAQELVVVATAALLAGSIAGLFADRWVLRLMPSGLRLTRAGRILERTALALAAYRDHGHVLARVAVLSFAVQGIRIVLAFVLGRGLGIDVPFRYYWVFMPLNILVVLLPLSLGGFGLPQGTMVWTLAPLGVAPTAAFLLSTLFVGAGLVGNLPGAWLYMSGRAADDPGPSSRLRNT